jgi:hypothetical protein
MSFQVPIAALNSCRMDHRIVLVCRLSIRGVVEQKSGFEFRLKAGHLALLLKRLAARGKIFVSDLNGIVFHFSARNY